MKRGGSIVKKAYLWIITAVSLAITSGIVFIFNLELSEEFTWWVSVTFNWEVKDKTFATNLLQHLNQNGFSNIKVNVDSKWSTSKIKVNGNIENDMDNTSSNSLSPLIASYLLDQKIIASSEDIVEEAVIWPSVGKYMRSTAMYALGLGLLAMMIYMIFSFGMIRKYIAPWILATVVLLSSLLSISLPLWAYGLWMSINSTIQVDTVFVIAILTIVGYGINDVIIIFDRVRENIIKYMGKNHMSYSQILDESIWQTLKRSLWTSLSTLLVLIAMVIFGTGVIQTFAFTVGVGVLASFLSSVFVAVPTAYLLIKIFQKK